MISWYKFFCCALLIFVFQNAMSTECVRLFIPFKSSIRGSDIAVAGEIIYFDDETGDVFVKVTERFLGNCQDTIRCSQYGLGLTFVFSKSGDKVILLLKKWKNLENTYYSEECGTHLLHFNDKKNKFSGNITYFNGFICRTLSFCRINKYPLNHMSYKRIERIVKRKTISKRTVHTERI